MQICISADGNNVITGYAIIGSIEGGEMITVDEIPEDLCRGYYKLVDGVIVLDEDLKAQLLESH